MPPVREYVEPETADEGYSGEVSALCGTCVHGGGFGGRIVYIIWKRETEHTYDTENDNRGLRRRESALDDN